MNLGQLLRNVNPAQESLVWEDGSLTYGELDRKTTELACALLDEGLQPGDRVAVHWSNAVQPVLLYFACFKAGLIAVPVNLRLTASEAEHIFRHSGAKVCFSQPELASIAQTAAAACGTGIVVRQQLPHGAAVRPLPEPDERTICALMYTSGTTALPKGVMHSHGSLYHGARFTLAAGTGRGVTITTTQVSHMSGFQCVLIASMLGQAKLVLMPKFDPAAVLDAVERHRVVSFIALPAQMLMLAEEQSQRPRDLSSLKRVLSGGDSVPEATQQRFDEVFGLRTLEVLAMTESCPMFWNTDADRRLGSVGKARAGVQVKVIPKSGLAADSGELSVRSPASFAGYWNDSAATEAVLEDGWLHTGDLARLDQDGFVWFTGRLKQVILRESVIISPSEVEDVLYKHPAVLEAGVIGLPDPRFGQKVVAFVALRDGYAASEDDLRAAAAQHLPDYKVPEVIHFLPVLPKGMTGKIDRRALAEGTA
jgi:long-chain acyl-CoA synthetase